MPPGSAAPHDFPCTEHRPVDGLPGDWWHYAVAKAFAVIGSSTKDAPPTRPRADAEPPPEFGSPAPP
jgi:hypothetical protein